MSKLLLMLIFATTAEAKKEKTATQDAVAPAAPTADIPSDANSKKFAKELLSRSFSDFTINDKMVYKSLSFSADNSFKASAMVSYEVGGDFEEMECTESGTWKMDAAESATKAAMTWNVSQSDCPGRDSLEETRLVVSLGRGGMDVEFR